MTRSILSQFLEPETLIRLTPNWGPKMRIFVNENWKPFIELKTRDQNYRYSPRFSWTNDIFTFLYYEPFVNRIKDFTSTVGY